MDQNKLILNMLIKKPESFNQLNDESFRAPVDVGSAKSVNIVDQLSDTSHTLINPSEYKVKAIDYKTRNKKMESLKILHPDEEIVEVIHKKLGPIALYEFEKSCEEYAKAWRDLDHGEQGDINEYVRLVEDHLLGAEKINNILPEDLELKILGQALELISGTFDYVVELPGS